MVDIAQLKDLIVNGMGRFIGKVYASEFVGKFTGNADSATKATQDESGNNIKASYAATMDISGTNLTLKNKNGEALKSVTLSGGSYKGTSAPSDTNILWIDTGNGGIVKYYNGSAWTPIASTWG